MPATTSWGPGTGRPDRRAGLTAHAIMWGVVLGEGLCLAIAIIGFVVAEHRGPEVDCGLDSTSTGPCWSHPQAGVGTAIALGGIVLGILVMLAAIVAWATVVGLDGPSAAVVAGDAAAD